MKTLFLGIFLVAAAVFLLCIKVIFKKGGRFPSGHAHDIPALRKKGASCAMSDEPDKQPTYRHN